MIMKVSCQAYVHPYTQASWAVDIHVWQLFRGRRDW